MNYQYDETWTEEDIFTRAKELEGISLKDIIHADSLNNKKNKGGIGNAIQADYFGIAANSRQEADFHHHNIELKVHPIKKNTKGFVAKERLVLSMIDFMKRNQLSFRDSMVYKKTESMLIIFYLHEENVDPMEFKILKVSHFRLNDKDFNIASMDYTKIHTIIDKGEAHLLTEKGYDILAPARKGGGKDKDLKVQHASHIKAKSRAYSYKSNFMTTYYRRLVDKNIHIIDPKENFKKFVIQSLDEFKGHTLDELKSMIDTYKHTIPGNNDKSQIPKILSKLLGAKNGNINSTDEFIANGFEMKTVVRYNKVIKGSHKKTDQDMSFRNIDFFDIDHNEFEDSEWYTMFTETIYILCLFKEDDSGELIFTDYIFHSFDDKFMAKLRDLFERTKKNLPHAKQTKDYNGNYTDVTLTSKSAHYPLQIRTKYTGQSKFVELPNGNEITKKCLFVNKNYIDEIFGLYV
ncbi:Sau3AI family type II restriction endonuclease [Macrococcus lamae]|uniref:DNA mismatch repair protein MutH n=1 Tax=Macrococcus lamae TaxID=198484 RepID=A0A4R6BTC2_9STAP|nr:Sau3AI family type II restriction endonuclease [Macrococcus lamae]TDM07711.1 DNA mismatch repair protein MutH [Macrococcus lamae]